MRTCAPRPGGPQTAAVAECGCCKMQRDTSGTSTSTFAVPPHARLANAGYAGAPTMAGQFKAIFWDNDGVLVDTEHLYFEATRTVLARVGVSLTHADYVELF